jgi:hypothetical protein
MSIEIVDNFLSETEFEPIKELMMGPYLPWYYNKFMVYDNGLDNKFQFTHSFYRHNKGIVSDKFDELKPCIDKLNVFVLLRVKANLTPRTEIPITSDFHIDFNLNNKTAIYYINTNNGCTIFEDNTRIESIENRMLIFDSSYKHTGITCTDEKVRVLINFNYFSQGE